MKSQSFSIFNRHEKKKEFLLKFELYGKVKGTGKGEKENEAKNQFFIIKK